MRAVKIIVEPFEYISLTMVECVKALNQHGRMIITGLIRHEHEQEYMALAARETWVCVKAVSEGGEEQVFFHGILTGMQMKKEAQASVMTIEIRTGSFLLDIEKHTRSFQDAGFSYESVVASCVTSAGGYSIMLEKEDVPTGCFLMQYNETDWAFIRRIASYAGVVLRPEYATGGKKIYLGYSGRRVTGNLEPDSYQVVQNFGANAPADAFGGKGFAGETAYIVQTREIYDLGDTVTFQGRKLVAGRIESRLEGQELCHTYHLIPERDGRLPALYNGLLHGVALKARVLAVETTVVQVQFDEDENKDGCGRRWFDFATVYSTPDGAGWYCMPEVGDEVRVVFPDNCEGHAYVASSVHVGSAGGRTNPDEKFWRNRHNKEIRFTPDSLTLTNNNGLMVRLSDAEGIKICSDKDIVLKSDGEVRIKSQNAGVYMDAADKMLFRQGAAKIQMEDAIWIEGGKIYMN
ncbi:MAG: phage baseplate assembly protein V [Lachnospiraceae bacterium]